MNEEKETFENDLKDDDLKDDDLKNDDPMDDDPKDDEDTVKPNNWLSDNQFSLQIGVILSAIAAFLVIIIGIFSGVSFFTMLWRVIVAGVLFFILGFGIGFLIKMFVPELADVKNLSENSDDYDVGSNVDFTIEDENDTTNNQTQKEFMDNLHDNHQSMGANNLSKKDKFSEHNLPDDPKLLAEGIRTMMKKDE